MAGKKLSQAKKQPDTAKKTYEYDDEALSAVERQLAEEDGLVLSDSDEDDKKSKKSDKSRISPKKMLPKKMRKMLLHGMRMWQQSLHLK